MPYIKRMSERVREDHYTMMRSLMFDFAADGNVKTICDEFMFGDDMLICPVLSPMYFTKGSQPIDVSRTRDCYLPAGTDWIDFWTRDRYTGGQTVTVNAAIDVMPIFVRAGAAMPMLISENDTGDL